MVASQFVVTPVIPEDYAAQGLVHVKRFIEHVIAKKNPQLRWLGLMLAMVQSRVSIQAAYEESLRDAYGDLVFDAKVPLATVFKEAVAMKTPVTIYKPKTPGARSVTKLHAEILSRVAIQQSLREAA